MTAKDKANHYIEKLLKVNYESPNWLFNAKNETIAYVIGSGFWLKNQDLLDLRKHIELKLTETK